MINEVQPVEQHAGKMTVEMLSLLKQVNILSSLDDGRMCCLAEVEQLRLDTGAFLAKQGEIAQYFWILLEGELKVFQTLEDGRESPILTIGAGSAMGELSLLANIPNAANVVTTQPSHLLRLTEEEFWNLMTTCPEVRKAILGNMAIRLQGLQKLQMRQEKMASLGTLAAGLMHELNNPGAAAKRAAAQLRENLMRMHALAAKFSRQSLSATQMECMFELQGHALAAKQPLMMNSLEQSDAEDALVEWLESAEVENAWKLAPTMVSIGVKAEELDCMRHEFPAPLLSDALNWLEAMASSMQLTATIEESIGRVGELVHAVKMYAYEGKGQRRLFWRRSLPPNCLRCGVSLWVSTRYGRTCWIMRSTR
jgi:CRP-like cAMP-binding protein